MTVVVTALAASALAGPSVDAAVVPGPAPDSGRQVAAVAATPATSSTLTPSPPSTWSAHRLAAQLVLAGVDMSALSDARAWAGHGLGGIVLFGSPPSDLGRQLAAVRAAEQIPPLVSSDEEGGEVQRLAAVIYALPSAEWMGAHKTPAQVRGMAVHYGRHMHALGVDMDLAPVADLLVPGHFIAQEHRAFASMPDRVGRYVNAWQLGMRSVHQITTAKHWPGHGHSDDTHQAIGVTPKLSYMKTHDMLPFESAFSHGVPAVMVGHLIVPGLTGPKTPASLSWNALHYLRSHAGTRTLIVTDSLSMGAIRTSLGLTQPQAAVRALRDGADMALVQVGNPSGVIRAIADAIRNGDYPRKRAVASVRRVLAAKRISTPPYRPAALRPLDGATSIGLRAHLSALVDDRLGGADRAVFSVRRASSTAWDVVPHGYAHGPAGTRLTFVVPAGRLLAAHAYEWRVRACNAASRCSAWSTVHTFTTA
jgi:beta-N-acetylhexosaminidase